MFESPDDGQHSISSLLVGYWNYHKIYFDLKFVNSSWNNCYKFWDVHIVRGYLYKSGCGHGTPEEQIYSWNRRIEMLDEIHPGCIVDRNSWTIERIRDDTFIAERDVTPSGIRCPQVRMWFNVEK